MPSRDCIMQLQQLATYLRSLPTALTIHNSFVSRYDFENFQLDPTWIDDIGTEGAINRELECRLGTRAHGPIEFTERGPAVEALVEVLTKYMKEFPDDVRLAKWVEDALAGAIYTYQKWQTPVCHPLFVHNDAFIDVLAPVAPRLEYNRHSTIRRIRAKPQTPAC